METLELKVFELSDLNLPLFEISVKITGPLTFRNLGNALKLEGKIGILYGSNNKPFTIYLENEYSSDPGFIREFLGDIVD